MWDFTRISFSKKINISLLFLNKLLVNIYIFFVINRTEWRMLWIRHDIQRYLDQFLHGTEDKWNCFGQANRVGKAHRRCDCIRWEWPDLCIDHGKLDIDRQPLEFVLWLEWLRETKMMNKIKNRFIS